MTGRSRQWLLVLLLLGCGGAASASPHTATALPEPVRELVSTSVTGADSTAPAPVESPEVALAMARLTLATALGEASLDEQGPTVTERSLRDVAARLEARLGDTAVRHSAAEVDGQLTLASVEEAAFDAEVEPAPRRTLSRAPVGAEPSQPERRIVHVRARPVLPERRVVRQGPSVEPGPGRGERRLPGDGRERWAVPAPGARLTSRFGPRVDPITGQRGKMHRGIDYAAPSGTAVLAAATGTVILAGWCSRGTGNCVVLDHGSGWRSQYFHLSRVDVEPGQTVRQGVRVGAIGSTGRSTGPHLHFQLGEDGRAVDPMVHLSQPVGSSDRSPRR